MTGAAHNRGASRQDYETPLEFLRAVERRFGAPTHDLAASTGNAKAPSFYTEADDSLRQDWHLLGGLLWLNPPFANIGPWARKCRDESHLGARILLLVPASVGSGWFAEYVHRQAAVFFLRGRLSFDGEGPYPKDCMLCVYNLTGWYGAHVWDWRKDQIT